MSLQSSSFRSAVGLQSGPMSAIPSIAPTSGEMPKNKVDKIYSLAQIDQQQPVGTVFLIDLDDTAFDFPYMLGSKAWRSYINKATKNDPRRSWHDVLSLHLTRHYPVKAVETITSQFIETLQSKGFIVLGLTARERAKWYDTPIDGVDSMTATQVDSIGVHFSHPTEDERHSYITENPQYFQGILFADTDLKGEFLRKLFSDPSKYPNKVVFIDDKESQNLSVAQLCHELGIDHLCFSYAVTEAKSLKFDALIANVQLYHFILSSTMLSDQDAAIIASQNTQKDAEYYLQEALNLYLAKHPTHSDNF